ncbi:amidohydrolase, partial [Streptomonospora algeriensis]
RDEDGQDVPVMHACGHDAHTACLVGTADLLAEAREEWRGTLMVAAQPGEETLDGATAMLRDGLYTRFGRPDVVLAQHLGPQPAGMVAHRAGTIMAATTNLRVRVFGSGGHAARPESTVDPVLIAANIVNRLQTIVAREISPSEMAVVTVGVLRAGTKHNVIPDDAYLEIDTRALNPAVSERLHKAIDRIVRAEAAASGAQRDPEITVARDAGVTTNEPGATAEVVAAHRAYFGEDRVVELPEPITGSEDFSAYGLPGDPAPVPYVYWFLGSTPHDVWEAAPGETPYEKMMAVPATHSAFFAPDREPTLRAGLAALSLGALTYLGTPEPPGGTGAGAGVATGGQAPMSPYSGSGETAESAHQAEAPPAPAVESPAESGFPGAVPAEGDDRAAAGPVGDFPPPSPGPVPPTAPYPGEPAPYPSEPAPVPYVYWFLGSTPHDVWEAAPG